MRRGRKNAELSTAEKVRFVQERLDVLSALVTALSQPEGLLQVVLAAEDPAQASAQLRERFGLSEIQAMAVLDMQFRRATRRDSDRMRAECDRLESELDQHRVQLSTES